jgi:hypothetical protein
MVAKNAKIRLPLKKTGYTGVFPLSQNSEISIGKQFWLDGNGV